MTDGAIWTIAILAFICWLIGRKAILAIIVLIFAAGLAMQLAGQ
jgi:hypothetical protein